MKTLTVYLNFPGTCSDALDFYKEVLKGEIVSKQSFSEAPMEIPPEYRDRLLHAEFRAEGINFMASDTMPGDALVKGSTRISLTLLLDDLAEQHTIYNAFAQDGEIVMPLEKTFWGASYGIVNDKFGIQWMLNCELPSAE